MSEGAPTGPLDGYRVIELGTLIAGPFAGKLLGDMGADVIKIESPTVQTRFVPGVRQSRTVIDSSGRFTPATSGV